VVEADARAAAGAGISGTPTALINGRKLTGAMPLEEWTRVVSEELGRPAGSPAVATRPAVAEARLPPGPAIRRLALPDGRMVFVSGPPLTWPPPRITLPDELLGPRLSAPFVTGDVPTRGPAKAAVEILYLTAAGCPGCANGKVVVDGLLGSYGPDLRIVARPLEPDRMALGGGEKPPVAEALWEAHAQGQFWQLHDAMIGGRGPLDRTMLEGLATEVGMDLGNLRAALDNGVYKARVEEDLRLAREANISPFPAFVVDGRLAASPVALVQLVESALRRRGRAVARPRDQAAALEVNPAAPGYDGRRLQPFLTVAQIFTVEPRDNDWASAVEKDLAPVVLSDLKTIDPQATGAFECHSTLCRLRTSARKDGPTYRFVSSVYRPREMVMRPPAGSDYFFDMRGQALHKPAAESAAAFRSRRSSVIYGVRTGRSSVNAGVPPERLPRE
jgi:predicted DsbA family dithiol-disulfide isomerase